MWRVIFKGLTGPEILYCEEIEVQKFYPHISLTRIRGRQLPGNLFTADMQNLARMSYRKYSGMNRVMFPNWNVIEAVEFDEKEPKPPLKMYDGGEGESD